jgi:hypothetical protein
VGECPYDPSPGREGHLHPDNVLAVYVWERLRTVGPQVLDMLHLDLTPTQSRLLVEQLHFLESYARRMEATRAAMNGAQRG